MYLVYTEAQWLILVMECNIMRGRVKRAERKWEKDVCVLFVNTGVFLTLNSERKHFSFGLIRDEKWLFDHACWIFCSVKRDCLC